MLNKFYNEYNEKSEIKKLNNNILKICILFFLFFYSILCIILLRIYNTVIFFLVSLFLVFFVSILCSYLLLLNKYIKEFEKIKILNMYSNLKKIINLVKEKEKELIKLLLINNNLYTKEKIKFIIDTKYDYYNKNDDKKILTNISFLSIVSCIISFIGLYLNIINSSIVKNIEEANIILSAIIIGIVFLLIFISTYSALRKIGQVYNKVDYEILYLILNDLYMEIDAS